jgi:hypothetical protein
MCFFHLKKIKSRHWVSDAGHQASAEIGKKELGFHDFDFSIIYISLW